MASGSMRKDPLKKTAFSDLKNTFSNQNSTPLGQKSGGKLAFGSAFSSSLNKPFQASKPQLKMRADFAKLKMPSFDFVEERPLKPVDFQRCQADMWLLNDEQIDRLLALRDGPNYMEPEPVADAALQIWGDDWTIGEPVKSLEEPLPPLPELDILDVSLLDELIGGDPCAQQQDVATRNNF